MKRRLIPHFSYQGNQNSKCRKKIYDENIFPRIFLTLKDFIAFAYEPNPSCFLLKLQPTLRNCPHKFGKKVQNAKLYERMKKSQKINRISNQSRCFFLFRTAMVLPLATTLKADPSE